MAVRVGVSLQGTKQLSAQVSSSATLDPALEAGFSIEYAPLPTATRNAWLKAASIMLVPFAR